MSVPCMLELPFCSSICILFPNALQVATQRKKGRSVSCPGTPQLWLLQGFRSALLPGLCLVVRTGEQSVAPNFCFQPWGLTSCVTLPQFAGAKMGSDIVCFTEADWGSCLLSSENHWGNISQNTKSEAEETEESRLRGSYKSTGRKCGALACPKHPACECKAEISGIIHRCTGRLGFPVASTHRSM